MTLNENFVVPLFPFNLTLPQKTDFLDYWQYSQAKKTILNQVLTEFLAQDGDHHALLSPKTLITTPTHNPTYLTNPYWQWLIKNNVSAYELQQVVPTGANQPLYSMNRMGQSSTLLPDGREILIGGESEDGYDAMFWIYNDVIVKHPNGHIEIFGYPRHVFAPTDFYTATLIGENIWIIGSLGYADDRQTTQTSVYKLNIETYKIEKVETHNSMGWVFQHIATLKDNQIVISGGRIWLGDTLPIVENFDTWALNLKTLIWKNITKKQWQCFYVQRKDGKNLHLWDYQFMDFFRHSPDLYQKRIDVITQRLGGKVPDFGLFEQLLVPPLIHELAGQPTAHEKVIMIDNIKVRYRLHNSDIQVYIEGILSPDKLELLQENLRHKLSKLENFACKVKDLVV